MATEFVVINKIKDLTALRNEWNALYDEAKSSFFMSYNYCVVSWLRVQEPLNRKLFVVIGRENGRLAFVWPLVKYRNRLWRTIRPLTSYSGQMSCILIHPDFATVDYVEKAWKFMYRKSRSHNCNFPFVRETTPLFDFLEKHKISGKEIDYIPVLYLNKEETWDEYYASLGGSHRRNMTRRRKILEKEGILTFKIIEEKDETARMLDWLIIHKRAWINKVGKIDHDLYSENFKNLMLDLTWSYEGRQIFTVFVLLLNNVPISVKVISRSVEHINRVMAAYDLDYSKASPGMILDEFINKWAYDQGLDIHFGAGLEESKLVWSKRNVKQLNSYQISNNLWGKIGFKAWKMLKEYKERKIKPHAEQAI